MKIQTGHVGKNDGFLSVDINGYNLVPPSSYFQHEQVVMDTCFENLDNITVRNNKTNGWAGTINVKVDGVDKKLDCNECMGSKFEHEIVVDGDGDSSDLAPTNCLNGVTCTLTISGRIILFLPLNYDS